MTATLPNKWSALDEIPREVLGKLRAVEGEAQTPLLPGASAALSCLMDGDIQGALTALRSANKEVVELGGKSRMEEICQVAVTLRLHNPFTLTISRTA